LLTDTLLSGQTALVLSDQDPISPISILGRFSEEFEVLEFKAGIIDGSFQDKDSLIKLSKLPGREALFGQVLGVMTAPSYLLVSTLQGNLQKLVYILKTKAG